MNDDPSFRPWIDFERRLLSRMRLNAFALIFTFLIVAFTTAASALAVRVGVSDRDPASRCVAASSDQHWSDAEQYVWRELCAGRVADLRRFKRDSQRDLSRAFLQTVLFRSQFATLIQDSGFRISGAHIRRSIDLETNKVTFPIWLDNSIFDRDLIIEDLTSTASVTLDNSTVRGKLDLSAISAPSVLMRGSRFHSVDLNGSNISQALILEKTTIERDKRAFGADDATFDASNAHLGLVVDFSGVDVGTSLSFNSSVISGMLFMHENAKAGAIDLRGAVIDSLQMDGVRVVRSIDADSATINRLLALRQSVMSELNVRNAHVGGALLMDGASVRDMNATDLEVFGSADLVNTRFRSVNLSDAKLDHTLLMNRARIARALILDGSTIGGNVAANAGTFASLSLNGTKIDGSFIADGASIGELTLTNAAIQRDLVLSHTWIKHGCDLTLLSVAGRVDLIDNVIDSDVSLVRLETGGDLLLAGGKMVSVDLTGAKIGSYLYLESGPASRHDDKNVDPTCYACDPSDSGAMSPLRWVRGGHISLQNASARAFDDRAPTCPNVSSRCADPWPRRVDLSGFRYQGLGAMNDRIADRPASFWQGLMSRDDRFSRQPYEQLTDALRQDGRSETAIQLVYAEKAREAEDAPLLEKIGLTLDRLLVGYGYRPYKSFKYALALFAIGVIVLHASGEKKRLAFTYGDSAVYSFDRLIP